MWSAAVTRLAVSGILLFIRKNRKGSVGTDSRPDPCELSNQFGVAELKIDFSNIETNVRKILKILNY